MENFVEMGLSSEQPFLLCGGGMVRGQNSGRINGVVICLWMLLSPLCFRHYGKGGLGGELVEL